MRINKEYFFAFEVRQREFVASGTRISDGQYVYGFIYKSSTYSTSLCIGTERELLFVSYTPEK